MSFIEYESKVRIDKQVVKDLVYKYLRDSSLLEKLKLNGHIPTQEEMNLFLHISEGDISVTFRKRG